MATPARLAPCYADCTPCCLAHLASAVRCCLAQPLPVLQVATLVLLMLATSMLANTATAATATPLKGRKLLIVTGSSIQANPLRRKLLGDESCYAVEPNHRCDSESQFYCCEYHDYSSKEWVGCSIHNNNKYCPQDSPLSVCCELDK